MTTDQKLAVEALTRGIVNKIMHTPISTLKTAARDPESTTVIDLVRRLFNLHDNLRDDNLHNEDEEKGAAASKSARGRRTERGAGKGPEN
jgi:glutamyl-tRNA reductase